MAVDNVLPILAQLFGGNPAAAGQGLSPALALQPMAPQAPELQPPAPPQAPMPAAPAQQGPIDRSTPAGDPTAAGNQPNVLARLRRPNERGAGDASGMGEGAVNAIRLAQGKSRWGALASGLAAGLHAQQAARERQATRAQQQLQQLFARNLDLARLQQGQSGLDLRRQAEQRQADAMRSTQDFQRQRLDLENRKFDRGLVARPIDRTRALKEWTQAYKNMSELIEQDVHGNSAIPEAQKAAEIQRLRREWREKNPSPRTGPKPEQQRRAPGAAQPTAQAPQPGDPPAWAGQINSPRVNSREEAMRLPPGSTFIGPDGKTYRVPQR